MTSNHRDYIKEALKTDVELLKLYSVFLIGIVSFLVSSVLRASYDKDNVHIIIFLSAILGFVFFSMNFFIFVRRIKNHLKQLKTDKP